MNYLRIGIGVLVLLLAAVSWGQYRQIGLQGDLIKKQEEAIRTATQKAEQILGIVERNDALIADMLTAQGEVSNSLSARQQEIWRLQNEVAEIRHWADQPLPADIVRMRQRTAATGARAYGQSVPAGGAMQTPGSEPQDERRPESGAGAN